MSNPIFDRMGSFGSSSNPQPQPQHLDKRSQILNLIAKNPKFGEVVKYINQNGGSAKAAFYNMAAEKGVDPEDILRTLR